MKFKPPVFVRYVARPLSIALLGGALAVFVFFVVGLIKDACAHMLTFRTAALGVLDCAIIIFGFWAFVLGLWDKLFATLSVERDRVIWKCLLKRTRRITMENVRYVGIEYEDSYSGLPYAYIYISATPYPKEYAHKINKLRCRDDFLIFRFTTELKDYLIATIPKGRSVALYDCDDFEANIHRRRAKKKRRK